MENNESFADTENDCERNNKIIAAGKAKAATLMLEKY